MENSNNSNLVLFPEAYTRQELNSLYRKIPLKDSSFRLLRKYYKAAANLYGIISLRRLYEVYASQNRNPEPKEKFLAFARIARHEIEGYFIFGKHELFKNVTETDYMDYDIISSHLLNVNDEDDSFVDNYDRLRYLQQGKDFYIPDKKDFLKHVEDLDLEFNGETLELLLSFGEYTDATIPVALKIIFEIYYLNRYNIDSNFRIFDLINEANLSFSSDEGLGKFILAFNNFMNCSIRLWVNRGFTPLEVSDNQLRPKNPLYEDLISNEVSKLIGQMNANPDRPLEDFLGSDLSSYIFDIISRNWSNNLKKDRYKGQDKIGRNDPCPCGSGLKYKRCCGK